MIKIQYNSSAWKEHLKLTETEIAENIGLIFKAKLYLNKDSLLALYFSYIHSYFNYAQLTQREFTYER